MAPHIPLWVAERRRYHSVALKGRNGRGTSTNRERCHPTTRTKCSTSPGQLRHTLPSRHAMPCICPCRYWDCGDYLKPAWLHLHSILQACSAGRSRSAVNPNNVGSGTQLPSFLTVSPVIPVSVCGDERCGSGAGVP
jgi:hypothetical protein